MQRLAVSHWVDLSLGARLELLRSYVRLAQPNTPMQKSRISRKTFPILLHRYADLYLDRETRPKARKARDSWKKQNKKNAKWHSSALVACEPVASLQGRLSEKCKARTNPAWRIPVPPHHHAYNTYGVHDTRVSTSTGCFLVHNEIASKRITQFV